MFKLLKHTGSFLFEVTFLNLCIFQNVHILLYFDTNQKCLKTNLLSIVHTLLALILYTCNMKVS